jgi:hypothetical protein
MFNKFKNTGLIVLMISLFAVVDAYGQVNCPTCPKGLTAPSSISSPQQGFNGYTSEVDHFDGTTPTCYSPTAATLNGHLRGINNALCAHRTRIDSLVGSDTALINRIDSLMNAIEDITTEFESTYNTSIISSDSSVNIISQIVGASLQFNLSVDIDSVKSKIVRNLDISCLGVPRNFDSIMNKLIDIACLTTNPTVDSCKVWRLYATNSIGSMAGTTTVSATSYSIGAVPADMCLTKIEYIYTLYDSTGAVMANGLISGTSTLGAVTSWTIPYGYIQGARSIKITARFWKEKCASNKYCGTQDSTLTSSVPIFSLSALVANDDIYSVSSSASQTFNVGSNDVIPYTVFASGLIRGASKGNAVLTSTSLQYQATSNGIDTLRYTLTDIYGQTDTAYIYITNSITSSPNNLNVTGLIDLCMQSGTSLRVYNSISITNDIGTPQIYSMKWTNDTGVVSTILNPALPVFTGLQSVTNGLDLVVSSLYKFSNFTVARTNTYGGELVITLLVTNGASIPKLLDITIDIPTGINTNYVCPTELENVPYTITEYDLP